MRTRSVAFLQMTMFLLLSAPLGALAQAKPPSELSLVLERHRAAVGGIAALEAVQSYREDGTYYSSKAANRFGYTLLRARTGLLRIESHTANGATCVLDAFDRTLRWATCGNEGFRSHPITSPERKSQQAFDDHLVRPSSAITLLGHERIDGRDAIHLRVAKTTSAPAEDYFLDPDTYLTSRIEVGGVGDRTVWRLSDYRRVGAITYRFRRDETTPDGTVFTHIVDKVTLNNTRRSSYFTPTAADRELATRPAAVPAPQHIAPARQYTAVFTCTVPGTPIPVFQCLDGTSIKIRTESGVKIYTQVSLVMSNDMNAELRVPLGEHFEVYGQNSMEYAELALLIKDDAGRIVHEDRAAQYGVVSASN